MKGLLKRDFYLIKKWSPWIFLLIGFYFVLHFCTNGSRDSFLIACLTAGYILCLQEIDDFKGNGFAFLSTLPFTRTEYVVSRYLVNFINMTFFGILATTLNWILICLRKTDPDYERITFWSETKSCAFLWCLFLIFSCVMMLLISIFRLETALLVFSITMISILVLVNTMLVPKLFLSGNPLQAWVSGLSDRDLALGIICVAIVIYLIFMFINIQTMKRREC